MSSSAASVAVPVLVLGWTARLCSAFGVPAFVGTPISSCSPLPVARVPRNPAFLRVQSDHLSSIDCLPEDQSKNDDNDIHRNIDMDIDMNIDMDMDNTTAGLATLATTALPAQAQKIQSDSPLQVRMPRTTTTDVDTRSRTPERTIHLQHAQQQTPQLIVGDLVGSGSYGTVRYLHTVQPINGTTAITHTYVGKRPWTQSELLKHVQHKHKQNNGKDSSLESTSVQYSPWSKQRRQQNDHAKQQRRLVQESHYRHERCLHYWNVERLCYEKLQSQPSSSSNTSHPQLPPYLGTNTTTDPATNEHHEWMLFDVIPAQPNTSNAALSLDHHIKLEHRHGTYETLQYISQALFSSTDNNENDKNNNKSFDRTCDTMIQQMLSVVSYVHSRNIVHRDIKPGNLLLSGDQRVFLIDFGSALDLSSQDNNEQQKNQGRGIFSAFKSRTTTVAISPLYSPPEVYTNADDRSNNNKDDNSNAFKFDVFSVGMIMCQLLFGILQEELDASFYQQLQKHDYDLNLWLLYELGSVNVRPHGMVHAVFADGEDSYFAKRPGLWKLLCEMIQKDPTRRPTAAAAYERFAGILTRSETVVPDEPFFRRLLKEASYCSTDTVAAMTTTATSIRTRPLHFVATFSKTQPFGLMLSEAIMDDTEADTNEPGIQAWKQFLTQDTHRPGEVYVKGIVPHSQAERMNCFQIGDRLHGIGEIPFTDGGFEQVVEMLNEIPSRNVRLHFDRITTRTSLNKTTSTNDRELPAKEIHVQDYGAWSIIGKRTSQEDTYILHEIHDRQMGQSVLVAGVMDGHGGSAASTMVSETLPSVLSNRLLVAPQVNATSNAAPVSVPDALLQSWNHVCDRYRSKCDVDSDIDDDDGGVCMAPYDAREGRLYANIGGVMAGTTASVLAVDEHNGRASILNCGDSRSIIVSATGDVIFATVDHKPENEIKRFQQAIADGNKEYSVPQCNLSRWWITVGEFEYAVSRSLEGPLATSKGIVSDADVDTIRVGAGMTIVSATDGLWNVMDSVEVGRDVVKLRQGNGDKNGHRHSARDAANALTRLAVQKGTDDNVSVVVVYL